jgi:hypothetical protein
VPLLAVSRSTPHKTAPHPHLLVALDVPDEVVQRVNALLHGEGELVVQGAQEVRHLARSYEVGGACRGQAGGGQACSTTARPA